MTRITEINQELSRLAKVIESNSGPGYRGFKNDTGREAAKRYDELMDERTAVHFAAKGNLYEVNLHPDEADLLDWDKPLSEQSEAVRKQLLGDLSADDLAAKVQAEGRQPTSLERLQMNYRLRQERGGFDPSGQAIYHDMRDRMGDPSTRAKTDKSASAALREAGIPGIKYMDQLSRGRSLPDLMAGRTDRIDAIADIRKRPPSERNSALIAEKQRHIAEYDKLIADYKPQTSNYVMFDAEDIEILDQGLLGSDPR
jgi:hypothetical protein